MIIIVIVLASIGCKQDTSREAFAGLKLGSTYRQYAEALGSPKFSSYNNIKHYTFNPENAKPFYGKVYCKWNTDSIILLQEVFIAQRKEELPMLGNAMFTKESDVTFNLVADRSEEVAQPEEIYQFLKRGYTSKYKLLEETTFDESSVRVYKLIFQSGKDVRIILYRYINMSPFEFEGLVSPTECIKVRYELTEGFIKEYKLDNYFSRTDDL
jgi:hypothetical protein